VAKFEFVIIEITILCDVLHLSTWCNWQTDWLASSLHLISSLKMMSTWVF